MAKLIRIINERNASGQIFLEICDIWKERVLESNLYVAESSHNYVILLLQGTLKT